jgi:hypothetical protein
MENITFLHQGAFYQVPTACPRDLPILFPDKSAFNVDWIESENPRPTNFKIVPTEEVGERCLIACKITILEALSTGMDTAGLHTEALFLVQTESDPTKIQKWEGFRDQNIAAQRAKSLSAPCAIKATVITAGGDEFVAISDGRIRLVNPSELEAKMRTTARAKLTDEDARILGIE